MLGVEESYFILEPHAVQTPRAMDKFTATLWYTQTDWGGNKEWKSVSKSFSQIDVWSDSQVCVIDGSPNKLAISQRRVEAMEIWTFAALEEKTWFNYEKRVYYLSNSYTASRGVYPEGFNGNAAISPDG